MTTATQAADRYAEITEIPRGTIDIVVRTIRPEFYPIAPQGRRSRAARVDASHVTAAHLVNLFLASAAATVIARAPEEIRRYRGLRRKPSRREIAADRAAGLLMSDTPDLPDFLVNPDEAQAVADEFFPGTTLGEALEALLRSLYDEHTRERARTLVREVTVYRGDDHAVIQTQHGPVSYMMLGFPGSVLLAPPEGAPTPRFRPPSSPAMRFVAVLPFSAFEILSDMARDTECVPGPQQLSRRPPGPTGGSENAETTAPAAEGTGPAPVVVSRQGANPAKPDAPEQHQDSDLRERGQDAPPPRSFGSPHRKWSRTIRISGYGEACDHRGVPAT